MGNTGSTTSCYSSSACNGTALSSSLSQNYSSCFNVCSDPALGAQYFSLDGAITSGTNCHCVAADQCSSPLYLAEQPTSVIYTIQDVPHPCQAIPFTPCAFSGLTCDVSSGTFFAGAVSEMQQCVNLATRTNLDIAYTFFDPITQFCYGFTPADCANGLVANMGYESAVIQYRNPNATCLTPCSDIDLEGHFSSIIAKAGHGKRGKPVRYTLTLVPHKIQPSPLLLQSSLDLRIKLSPLLEVTKAYVKGDTSNSPAHPAVIDRATDTVTWEDIGDALLGVGSKRAVPQKLTFTIVATLARDIPKGADIDIEAYLVDEGNVCEVLVAETEIFVRDPSGLKGK